LAAATGRRWSIVQRMDHQEVIRSFLAERFLFDREAAIDPSSSLIQGGVLDSTGVMEVVMFLEDTFGLKVQDQEIVAANFETIDGMCRFVDSKTASRAA
jgi:acyl carrier protein